MLISNNASYGILVKFDFKFDDPSMNKTVHCRQGDRVKIKFHEGTLDIEILPKDVVDSEEPSETPMIPIDLNEPTDSEESEIPTDPDEEEDGPYVEHRSI